MDKSITYINQINPILKNVSVNDWHSAVDAYDSKNYSDALMYVFKYLDKNFVPPSKNNGHIEFSIPHGSIIVKFKLTENEFFLEAPFLKVDSEKPQIGLLRQITELNFSNLVLAQIVLKENNLFFHFADQLENCEPYKIYSLIQELCYCADYYDDIFIDKFKTESVLRPQLRYFSNPDKDRSYEIFTNILKKTLANLDYLENKRYYQMQCDYIGINLLQIDYIICPQGSLGTEISDIIKSMYGDDNAQNIASTTRPKLEKLLNFDKEKFYNSLYYPHFLVPVKKIAEIPFVQDFFKKCYDTCKQSISNSAYMDATFYLQFMVYDLIYKNHIPNIVSGILEKGLQNASEKNWEQTAKILMDALNQVMLLDPDKKYDETQKLQKTDSEKTSSIANVVKKFFKGFL